MAVGLGNYWFRQGSGYAVLSSSQIVDQFYKQSHRNLLSDCDRLWDKEESQRGQDLGLSSWKSRVVIYWYEGRRKRNSAWNMWSVRMGWEVRKLWARDINLGVLTIQTVPTTLRLDGIETNGDEIVKVARVYFEANKVLWAGQISLLTASEAPVERLYPYWDKINTLFYSQRSPLPV